MPAPTVAPPPLRRLGWAFTLRCPECGGRGLFQHWLRLRPTCATCGLKLDRGAPDHFLGAYVVNLIVAELLFATILGAWVLSVWPDVPWGTLEVVAVVAVIASPFVTYPFTRTLWLAADLIFDPAGPTDR